MKKLSLLLFSVFFIAFCKNKSGSIEDQLYSCMLSSLSEREKEALMPIISDFEEHLIMNEILESSSAESYWNLYNKMAETEVYDFSNEFGFSKKIRFLEKADPTDNQQLIDCHERIFQSDKYLQSKHHKLKTEMQALRGNRITPVIIAKTTIKYFTVEDFELDYNRFNTLLFIENFK
ncbi:MAG: hypothetical protein AB3N14_08075 [Flavobacteriaceae bacterium]